MRHRDSRSNLSPTSRRGGGPPRLASCGAFDVHGAGFVLRSVGVVVESVAGPVGDRAGLEVEDRDVGESRFLENGSDVDAIPHPLVRLAALAGIPENEVLDRAALRALMRRAGGLT